MGRQARWLEKISEFDFEIVYVPGMENIVSDMLSYLYSNKQPGMVRARSKYTYFDAMDNNNLGSQMMTMLVLVGTESKEAYLKPDESTGSVLGPSMGIRASCCKQATAGMVSRCGSHGGTRGWVPHIVPERQHKGEEMV